MRAMGGKSITNEESCSLMPTRNAAPNQRVLTGDRCGYKCSSQAGWRPSRGFDLHRTFSAPAGRGNIDKIVPQRHGNSLELNSLGGK